MNTTDHGYIALGKYSGARDDMLHFLCTNEWANESFGDVEAPTGYVYRISNTLPEVHIPNTEITSVLADWFTDNQEVTDSPALRAELVGHFLVVETSTGAVNVEQFPDEPALLGRFHFLKAQYEEFLYMNSEDV